MKRGADPRLLLALGFTGFAVGTYQVSMMTTDWDFNELLIPQILRGLSLMLIMIPVTNTALGTTAPWKLKNASGLFNLVRVLGGALGSRSSTPCSTSGPICIWRGCMSLWLGGVARPKIAHQSRRRWRA